MRGILIQYCAQHLDSLRLGDGVVAAHYGSIGGDQVVDDIGDDSGGGVIEYLVGAGGEDEVVVVGGGGGDDEWVGGGEAGELDAGDADGGGGAVDEEGGSLVGGGGGGVVERVGVACKVGEGDVEHGGREEAGGRGGETQREDGGLSVGGVVGDACEERGAKEAVVLEAGEGVDRGVCVGLLFGLERGGGAEDTNAGSRVEGEGRRDGARGDDLAGRIATEDCWISVEEDAVLLYADICGIDGDGVDTDEYLVVAGRVERRGANVERGMLFAGEESGGIGASRRSHGVT